MAVRVSLQFATPDMRLARPIHDRDGQLIAGAGTQLIDQVRRALHKMAVQTVPVAEPDAPGSWETIRPLDEELAGLARRFAAEPASAPLATLHDAIARYLDRRAGRLALEADEP